MIAAVAAPGAFLCYARDDDEAESGKISWFKDELEKRVRFHGLVDFEIFQDRSSIEYSAGGRRRSMGRSTSVHC